MMLPIDIVALSIDEVWTERGRLLDALTVHEQNDYAALRYKKRQRDWLAGRVAAKRAMQRMSGLPFGQLEIRAEQDGPTSGRPSAFIAGRCVGYLSISHSADLALATWSTDAVGIDTEIIEARDESFVTLAFTTAEQRRIHAAPDRAAVMTRLWCEKEAYAKYLGVGFRRSFSDLVIPSDVARDGGYFVHGDQPMCWARVTHAP